MTKGMSSLAVALSKVLEEARVAKGMTKRRLAREVDVEPSYITHIFAGRRTPSFEVFVQLSRALGMAPSRVLELAEGRELADATVAKVDAASAGGC